MKNFSFYHFQNCVGNIAIAKLGFGLQSIYIFLDFLLSNRIKTQSKLIMIEKDLQSTMGIDFAYIVANAYKKCVPSFSYLRRNGDFNLTNCHAAFYSSFLILYSKLVMFASRPQCFPINSAVPQFTFEITFVRLASFQSFRVVFSCLLIMFERFYRIVIQGFLIKFWELSRVVNGGSEEKTTQKPVI